jgi:[histone H3]-lysine4 N-trimethyltransferase ATXR3
MGGKINGIERADLHHTTAEVEGMTGDARGRRKRKPSPLLLPDEEDKSKPKAAKTKIAKAVKPTATAPGAVKRKVGGSKNSKTTTTTTDDDNKKRKHGKNPKNGKKRPVKESTKMAKTLFKKTKIAIVEEPPETTSSLLTSHALDMYERHRREFERSISRLEKADHYSFFLGDVPEEFQESYSNDDPRLTFFSASPSSSNDDQETTVQASSSPTGQPDHIPSSSRGAPNVKTSSQVRFPDHPPYNFIIIRQRMIHGRYVMDLESIEEQERRQRLAPYFQSLSKRRVTPSSYGGTAATTRTLFPKGINWTLLRQDVIGMCDGALERNPELGSGGPGTLSHSAKKIKEALEQVYEKTGKRHDAEIALANDRHRFHTAIAASENNDAAMQGKWRRIGKTLATILFKIWVFCSRWDQKKASSLTILFMLVYSVIRQPFQSENMSD